MDDRTAGSDRSGERSGDRSGHQAGTGGPPADVDSAAWWSRPAEGAFAVPVAPPPGSEPYGSPATGTGLYGTEPYVSPARGSEPYGSPAQGSAYGLPAYGRESYGSPAYGPPSGAPAWSAQGQQQPAWGQPPQGQAPYGEAPFGQPLDAGDPWSRSRDTLGGPDRPRPRTGRGLAVVAALLAAGLIGGVSGGAFVSARDNRSLTDPSANLGSGVSTAGTIERAPDSVAGIAGRVLRSTVSISVTTATGGGSGSGVVLRADGYVLTNNHVVAPGAKGGTITVTVNGGEGRELPAQIVGRDPETDLAVLKVDRGAAFEPAVLGSSAGLVVGDPVIAIGSPLGLNGTVTTGIISALNRTVNVPAEGGGRATPLLNAIQTDAAINPGNSGGALVDVKGAVIGINSAIATLGGSGSGDQSGSIGVGFAIPVDEARSVAEEIIRTGRATHPAVGVEAGNEIAKDGTKQGARVTRVTSGGPAATAGLQVGDVIDKVGQTAVGSVDELVLALRQSKVGERVTVSYVRGGEVKTAQVVLADKGGG